MPPVPALLLCTVFVLFLLRLDRIQTRTVSHATWIPTIWMLLIAIKPLSAWFNEESASDAEGNLIDRVVLTGILCAGLFALANRKLDWPRTIKANAWLILLIGYTLVSVLWSDITYISFKRWIREELLAVVMACVVLTEQDPRQALQSVLRRTIYILIPFSLLLIKYYPQYGVVYGRWKGELMWVGVTDQKNGLGRLCLVAIFFLVWQLIRRWRGREEFGGRYQPLCEVLLTGIALWLLWGGGISTYSATAIAALTAGLVMLFSLLSVNKGAIRLVAWTWVATIAIIFIYGVTLPFVAAGGSVDTALTSVLGRNETFTGRTAIWARLLPFFEQDPILGHGFGGFWTSAMRENAYGVNEAHNGYLALCLELGIIGLVLTAMFLVSFVRKAQKTLVHDTDWGILCLCFVLMVVVHNVSESSIHSLQRQLTATLILLSVAVAARVRQKSDHRTPSAGPAGNRPPVKNNTRISPAPIGRALTRLPASGARQELRSELRVNERGGAGGLRETIPKRTMV
jgi:exopolysaccharide production protein ExoQ